MAYGSPGASGGGDGELEEVAGKPTPTLAKRPEAGWNDWWRVHARLNPPSVSPPEGPAAAAGGSARKQPPQSAAAHCNRAPPPQLLLLIGSPRFRSPNTTPAIARPDKESLIGPKKEKKKKSKLVAVTVAWKRRRNGGEESWEPKKGAIFQELAEKEST